jgi:hypothetical protein
MNLPAGTHLGKATAPSATDYAGEQRVCDQINLSLLCGWPTISDGQLGLGLHG